VLAHIPCFYACQFSRNYPRQFFRGGAFLYSGFTFPHCDLPLPTQYCIPYVRSVCINLSFASRDFVCPHMTSIRIIRFCPSAWTPRFQSESSCVSLVHGPGWLFLLSRHLKAFLLLLIRTLVNKDLCTRKSVKRTIEVVRAKHLASAWQLKMSGSFSRELEQYSYND